MMPTQGQNVSQATGSAVGPTLPLPIFGQSYGGVSSGSPVVDRYALSPIVAAYLSPGATLNYQFEFTTDQPDSNGNWPSPGNWLPLAVDGPTQFTSSNYFILKFLMTGIRVNVLSLTSGSLLLRVSQ